MYDIIARRRLSTVLRYIFDFLPKEETSIHLNTKKAVLSDRRNSDTEPYIMLNIFFVEDISSPRCGGRQIKTPYTVRLLSSRSPANFVSPSALFSHLSVSAFLLHHRMRFKTLQYCPSSVTATDKSRRRTLSDLYLLVPRQTSFPLPLFSRLSVSAFTAPPYAFLNSSMPTQLRYGVRQSRRRTLLGLYLPVPGKPRFPFRSFLAFRFPLFTAPPYAFQNSSILPQLRCGGRQIKTPYTVRHLSSGSRHVTPGFKGYLFDGGDYLKVLEGVLLC